MSQEILVQYFTVLQGQGGLFEFKTLNQNIHWNLGRANSSI